MMARDPFMARQGPDFEYSIRLEQIANEMNFTTDSTILLEAGRGLVSKWHQQDCQIPHNTQLCVRVCVFMEATFLRPSVR